jgi:hypothetical protein
MRTASALVDCFFGAVFGVLLFVGVIGDAWAGIIERCSTGCTLTGPVDIGFCQAIFENSGPTNLFDVATSGHPSSPGR